MKTIETIRTAFVSLQKNKIRSFLTMLGVVIGVFAIAALVATIRGFQNYITDQFNSLGTNIIYITPGKLTFTDDPSKAYASNKLEVEHVDLIKTDLGDKVISITPEYELAKRTYYKTNNYLASIIATNEKGLEIFNVELEKGSFYTKADVDSKQKVALIGSEIAKQLFGTKNPIDEKIKIENTSYKVIGLISKKSADYDTGVYIPDSTAVSEYGLKNVASIVLKFQPELDANSVKQDIRYSLLKQLGKDEFTVSTQADLLESINGILGIIETGLAAVAGISLLVGGIGIMNIMLVSVTERTREIGLRKALGATGKDIGLQFVSEAVFISITGGLGGLVFAWLGTLIAQHWIRAEIPVWAVFLAIGFSAAVGIGFGTYPAIKAAKKDPIVALRYE